jgi:hypothetical protein
LRSGVWLPFPIHIVVGHFEAEGANRQSDIKVRVEDVEGKKPLQERKRLLVSRK